MPCVSVIMATYNTPNEWLKASIDSIINQTYSDFEFIIIDDCSTTDLRLIQEEYIDDRIKWIKNEENMGLTKSLNKALKIATGKYIARMDADDISLPIRFAVEVEYMEKHPDVIVCGSWRRAIGIENKNEIWNIPKTREEQQVQMFFSNCGLTHPTAMFRKSMLDQYSIQYNENYIKAQDYGIWVQCTRYAPMAMIHKVLLNYRKSDKQVTANKESVKGYASKVKTDQLIAIGINATEEEKDMHIALCLNTPYPESQRMRTWVERLIRANEESQYFYQPTFKKVLEHKWYEYCKSRYVEEQNDSYKAEYYKLKTIQETFSDFSIGVKRQIIGLLRR